MFWVKFREFSLSPQKDRRTMDIKTLLHNLREEVSCPVCTNIYTEPKHLPCRHSFCLQCLKHWHRPGHGRDTITCPKCQLVSRVPDSGDLADLPTSVHLNALIDVLAIKECKTSQAGCGNCSTEELREFLLFPVLHVLVWRVPRCT